MRRPPLPDGRAARARARKLLAIARVPEYRRALRFGTAAAVEHDRDPYRHAFRTVLDVGAGRGQFALVAARRVPGAALICFEPLPGPRRKLERALAGHHDLTVLGNAVSDSTGEAEFVVSRADDSSSLLAMTAAQLRHFPGTEEVERVVVSTTSRDEAVPAERLVPPVLLKVDVQGSELGVLRGATRVLREVDSAIVECSFAELYRGQALAGEVIAHLDAGGFRLQAVCSPLVDEGGCLLQADLLFERLPGDPG